MRAWVETEAAKIAARAEDDLRLLADISSPNGDRAGAERMVQALDRLLPRYVTRSRPTSSSAGYAPDLMVKLEGQGRGRILLNGHLDTVISHHDHRPLHRHGDKLIGSGTYDMKAGLVMACGVLRALAQRPDLYQEVALLAVADEEARHTPMNRDYVSGDYDAYLCFEGGERSAEGKDAVVVRRKGATTLKIEAKGVGAHSGAAPEQGASALAALASLVPSLTQLGDELTVVPVILQSGSLLNQVPGQGTLVCDVRSCSTPAMNGTVDLIPAQKMGVQLQAQVQQRFPGMNCERETAPLLARASLLLGQEVVGASRGGSSDACFFADTGKPTVDGLGPLAEGEDPSHAPHEHVLASSFEPRTRVALSVTLAALGY